MNFRFWLEEKASRLGDHPYLFYQDEVISYKQLDLMSNKASNMLRKLGLGQKDKCAVVLDNCPEYLYLWFGCSKIGAVTACVNRHLRGEGLRYLIDSSDSKVLIMDAQLIDYFKDIEARLPKIEHVIWFPESPVDRKNNLSFKEIFSSAGNESPPNLDIKKGDPMTLMHTGGTTGLPKWCMISQNYYMEIGRHFADFLGLTQKDRLFNPLPLFHMNPQGYYVMGGLAANASLLMVERFSASSFWSQVRNHKVTCLILHVGVVDILNKRAYEEKENDHGVRIGYRLDAPFMKRFHIPVGVVGYGSTEAGGLVTMNRYRLPLSGKEESLTKLASVCGKPRDDMEITIADDQDEEVPAGKIGEILVRSKKPHVIFDGYYNDREKTVESFRNFWFHTGDMGFLDEERNLNFVRRKDESIRVKGEWVFISEVEEVIKKHPAVHDCAVVGVPGDVGGDEIKAVVELNPKAQIDPREIMAHCEGKLAYFMIPRYIEFVAELPRTEAAGRVKRKELKETGVVNAWDRVAAGTKLRR